MNTTPTTALYSALQQAYEHFNHTLFDQQLPEVLFTTQRNHGVMGYFAPDRWGASNGHRCHEIAINPMYVGKASIIELMQTLVHEMTHCWQHCYGKPSQRAYHNKEWSDKMVAIGLMPSTTGCAGGKRVGQKMSDYPMPNGQFIQSTLALIKTKQFELPWIDRLAKGQSEPLSAELIAALDGEAADLIDELTTTISDAIGEDQLTPPESNTKKVKHKYTCPSCQLNVWGKENLHLRCEPCDQLLSTNCYP